MSGPVAPENSESEAVEESSTEAGSSTVVDGKQLWKDIQAQTGFDSYEDYIAAYMKRDRSDLGLLWSWMIFASDLDNYDRCYIVDVSAHEDWPPKLSTRYHGTSGLELLAALRQPPKHVCVQIVL